MSSGSSVIPKRLDANTRDLLLATQAVGEAFDTLGALKRALDGWDVGVTSPLVEARLSLEQVQKVLTYELGVCARADYANRPMSKEIGER